MKTNSRFMWALAAACGLALTLSSPAAAQNGRGPGRGGDSGAAGNAQQGTCLTASVPTQPATADEAKWLVFMREEEKLARDVYQQLSVKWNLRVFDRISQSEQRHFDAIGALLTRYGITDPTTSTVPGAFTDPKLATLYAELLAKGTASLKDAIEVGLAIEKQDIEDLEVALKATSKSDIKRVYTNLLNGSLNHQDAFEANLEMLSLPQ